MSYELVYTSIHSSINVWASPTKPSPIDYSWLRHSPVGVVIQVEHPVDVVAERHHSDARHSRVHSHRVDDARHERQRQLEVRFADAARRVHDEYHVARLAAVCANQESGESGTLRSRPNLDRPVGYYISIRSITMYFY